MSVPDGFQEITKGSN